MNEKKHSYKNLVVWQKSMDLVEIIYKTTNKFPKHELFCLTSQIRRSAISIPSNIAEGQKRKSIKEFTKFLRVAYSSGAELETQIEITKRIGYLSEPENQNTSLLLEEIMKMLNALLRKFESL